MIKQKIAEMEKEIKDRDDKKYTHKRLTKSFELKGKLKGYKSALADVRELIEKKKFDGDKAYNYTNTKMIFLNADEILEDLK